MVDPFIVNIKEQN